jgi:hypothetical protein
LRAEKGKKLGIFARLEAKWKVTMKRIPFGGLKLSYSRFRARNALLAALLQGDNEENPLRGIETFPTLPQEEKDDE